MSVICIFPLNPILNRKNWGVSSSFFFFFFFFFYLLLNIDCAYSLESPRNFNKICILHGSISVMLNKMLNMNDLFHFYRQF